MKYRYNSAGYAGLILAMFISISFILNSVGWALITGSAEYWNAEDNDVGQHLTGINLYLSNLWQFPLLAFDSLNYPQGTRVTFVDGIPLLSFFLKIFLFKDHGYINPLGYWLGLSFLLQGVSAWWITYELQIKSWFFLIFLTVIFLTYPALSNQLIHVALTSQWLLLFAIALYLRSQRLHQYSLLAWTLLLISAFYTHIYFFPMVLGVYVATLFSLQQRVTWRYFLSAILPLIILGASLFVFLLPLSLSSLQAEKGFGLQSMNLISPIYGGQLFQIQADLSFAQRITGLNYLGLGVILLFFFIVFFEHKKAIETIKKHKAFLCVMLVFFIYSLSNRIYFGEKLIAILAYPKFLDVITSQFRASGRFFWPVGYAIIIFSIYILYRQYRPRVFSVIVCFLLLIQCIDTQQYYDNLKVARNIQPKSLLDHVVFEEFLGKNVHYGYIYPKYGCGGHYKYNHDVILSVTRYAAMNQLKLNTGYISRSSSNCQDMAQEIARSNHQESIYVFSKADFSQVQEVVHILDKNSHVVCLNLEFEYVCRFER